MRPSFVIPLLAASLLATGAPWPALAQTRATAADLTGVVLDSTRAVLPGATITAIDPSTGLTRVAVSDESGRFVIPALPPGAYEVRADLDGFEPFARSPVVLTLGTTVELEIFLAVARVEERVVVEAGSTVSDAALPTVAQTIVQSQIDALPIDVRNFLSFSLITAGVAQDRTPQQGVSATSGLTFAGQRGRSNNITVDGVDNNDAIVGSVRATFSQEAVREFQVVSSAYSAEFGKASGGIVNIVTRSGTNELQGTVFGFFRDDALNAKEYFERFDQAGMSIERPKAPYRQVQFGGAMGGPIRRDRLFYFVSVERLAIDTNNFVTIDDVTMVPHPVNPDVSLGTPAGILRRAGFAVETGNVPYEVSNVALLGKLDYQPRAEHRLSARVNASRDRNENIEPFGGQVARSRGAAIRSADVMAAASYDAILSDRAVNELRVLAAWRDQKINALDPSCSGVCDRIGEGGPTIEVSGFAAAGRQRFTPQPRDNLRVQIVDTFTRYAGTHQIKAGIDTSWVSSRQTVPLHFGGRYIFARELLLPLVAGQPPVPVSSIQAVALGLPAAYVQGYGHPTTTGTYGDLSLFAQHDWRLTERVTLKLGLRYQRQVWPSVTYEVAGYPVAYEYPTDTNDIAPRLGVGWDVRGDGRLAVHGAYGVFYDNQITGIAAITDLIDGGEHVRTLVLTAPAAWSAWSAPGRRLDEDRAAALAGGSFPSTVITVSPKLKTPFAHHVAAGADAQLLGGGLRLSADVVYVRGFNHAGTIDYNPIVAPSGRRPLDVGGIPGTSASVLQYTPFGETWYRGLLITVRQDLAHRAQWQAGYTLSSAQDTSTDFQSAFLPQNNGFGRNPADIDGLPLGFDPAAERGPSVQDQRHRFVLSGVYQAPRTVQMAAILTAGSGRPYTILAGIDLNGDGNGGAFPPDRARANPADEATSVPRNTGTLPAFVTLDLRLTKAFAFDGRRSIEAMVEVFNVLNRANFTDVQNVFGPGAYPSEPAPTFGQFTQAAAPRQAQLGLRLRF